jgi:hypothetical protein
MGEYRGRLFLEKPDQMIERSEFSVSDDPIQGEGLDQPVCCTVGEIKYRRGRACTSSGLSRDLQRLPIA